MTQRATGPA